MPAAGAVHESIMCKIMSSVFSRLHHDCNVRYVVLPRLHSRAKPFSLSLSNLQLCALTWADLSSQLSPTPVSNPVESPFDKRQYTLQGQDTGRKPGWSKVLFWLSSPIVHGLGTAHCPEGGGWRRGEEWFTVRTSHYYASTSSDHSEGPMSPFSVLNSWQPHSETCEEEGGFGSVM